MISLITGTIREDYQPIGGNINGSWIEDYGIGYLDPVLPMNLPLSVLVFTKRDKTWEGRISWFPSKRKDWIGTHIRYAILGKGKIGDDDSHLFLALINYVIESIENDEIKKKQEAFGNKLDECFTEEKLKTFLQEDSSGCGEDLRRIIKENLKVTECQKEDSYPFINSEKKSILYVNNMDKLQEGYNLLVSDVELPFDTLVVYNSKSFSNFEKLEERKASGVIYIEGKICEKGNLKQDIKDFYNFDSEIDSTNNTSIDDITQIIKKKLNSICTFLLQIWSYIKEAVGKIFKR